MRAVLFACAAFFVFVFVLPARAENWVKYDDWYYYDSDSATYDSSDDIVVVYASEDIGWIMDEDEYWDNVWMAFRCGSNESWTWSEKDQSWGNGYTLDPADEFDEAYVWTRDRLCGMRWNLPARDF